MKFASYLGMITMGIISIGVLAVAMALLPTSFDDPRATPIPDSFLKITYREHPEIPGLGDIEISLTSPDPLTISDHNPNDDVIIPMPDNTPKDPHTINREKIIEQQTLSSMAFAISDPTGCDKIESENAAENCRAQIYFKRAVAERNPTLCDKIQNSKQRANCKKSVY